MKHGHGEPPPGKPRPFEVAFTSDAGISPLLRVGLDGEVTLGSMNSAVTLVCSKPKGPDGAEPTEDHVLKHVLMILISEVAKLQREIAELRRGKV